MKSHKKINGIEIITEISDDFTNFKIGCNCELRLRMSNKEKEQFEAEITLHSGWNREDLSDIIMEAIERCKTKMTYVNAVFSKPYSLN